MRQHWRTILVKGITNMEEKILCFIKDYIEKSGFSPSYREISKGVGLSSTSSIHHHIMKLKKEGKLIGGELPRTLRLP